MTKPFSLHVPLTRRFTRLSLLGSTAALFCVAPGLQAQTATYDEESRQLISACVEPQVNGEPALKNGEPKTHTVTLQFSEDLLSASAIAASKVAGTDDCSGVFELTTGIYTDQFEYDGETMTVTMQYTSGFDFSTLNFLPSPQLPDNPMLWRVSMGGDEVILGGVTRTATTEFIFINVGPEWTDVLRPGEEPPAAYLQAYEESDRLITEVDPLDFGRSIIQLNNLLTVNAVVPFDLTTDLSPAVRTQVEDILALFGATIDGVNGIRPYWLTELLETVILLNSGYGIGMESTLAAMARADSKVHWGLEGADDAMLARNLNQADEDPNQVISDAMAALDNGDFLDEVNALIDAWRTGDEDYLKQALVDPVLAEAAIEFEREFSDRWAVWLPTFDNLFGNNFSELVIVDVKHLVGPNSFLTLLEDNGYTIEDYQ